jgi:hypothetical protein
MKRPRTSQQMDGLIRLLAHRYGVGQWTASADPVECARRIDAILACRPEPGTEIDGELREYRRSLR